MMFWFSCFNSIIFQALLAPRGPVHYIDFIFFTMVKITVKGAYCLIVAYRKTMALEWLSTSIEWIHTDNREVDY